MIELIRQIQETQREHHEETLARISEVTLEVSGEKKEARERFKGCDDRFKALEGWKHRWGGVVLALTVIAGTLGAVVTPLLVSRIEARTATVRVK